MRRLPLAAAPVLAGCALAFAGCAGVRPVPVAVPTPLGEDPTALVVWRGGLAVASGESVRIVEDGRVVREVAMQGRIWDMAGADTLWTATAAGLVALPTPTAEPVTVALPPARANRQPPDVRAVAVGSDGRVWIATRYDGAFARTDGRWAREAEAFPVTGVVPQADAVWVGTHQGVTRVGADGTLVQYTEEGTTEHGLYDNVADRLVETADGAVWAIHPEGVSVFTDGEPHGYAFVGRRGAALHDVAALPGGGYVLATTAGVLHVPALSEKPQGFYEVYTDSGADAAPLSVAPLGEAAPTRLALSADGSMLWFASRDGLWSVPVEALRPALAAR